MRHWGVDRTESTQGPAVPRTASSYTGKSLKQKKPHCQKEEEGYLCSRKVLTSVIIVNNSLRLSGENGSKKQRISI